jgi:hypothetical protein
MAGESVVYFACFLIVVLERFLERRRPYNHSPLRGLFRFPKLLDGPLLFGFNQVDFLLALALRLGLPRLLSCSSEHGKTESTTEKELTFSRLDSCCACCKSFNSAS